MTTPIAVLHCARCQTAWPLDEPALCTCAAGPGPAPLPQPQPEAVLSLQIRRALAERFPPQSTRGPRLVLWRNNVGVAHYPGAAGSAAVRYGLAPGMPDLVGILDTPSVAFARPAARGRFIGLEVKRPALDGRPPGRVSRVQEQALRLIRAFGGFAAVVRSVDDACAAIERAAAGLDS